MFMVLSDDLAKWVQLLAAKEYPLARQAGPASPLRYELTEVKGGSRDLWLAAFL